MIVLPDEKVISEAMKKVYQKWKKAAKRQEKINWKKRAERIEQEIENILKGGD